jgi:hypothetical protein
LMYEETRRECCVGKRYNNYQYEGTSLLFSPLGTALS